MADLTPDDVATREFRSGFRGYEMLEVRAFLADVAAGLSSLVSERDRLRTALESAEASKSGELSPVMAEIGSVLDAAKTAAERIRAAAAEEAAGIQRAASQDAEKTRSGASADAARLVEEAAAAAEATTEDMVGRARSSLEEAESRAKRRVGEAEQEAIEIEAAARRDAEQVVRAARAEAEQVVAEAKKSGESIVAAANRESEAALQRNQELEAKRRILLDELEAVRSAISDVENKLDARRQSLGLPDDPARSRDEPTPKVVPPPKKPMETWEPGETVRVVMPSRPGEPDPEPEMTTFPPKPEVKVLSGSEFARRKADLESKPVVDTVDETAHAVDPAESRPPEESTTIKVVRPGSPPPEPAEPIEDSSGAVESAVAEEADPQSPVPEVSAEAAAEKPVEPSEHDSAVPPGSRVIAEPGEPVAHEEETEQEPADPPQDEMAEPEPGVASPVAESISYDPVVVPANPPRLQSAPRIVPAPVSDAEQPQLFKEVAPLFDKLRGDEPEPASPTASGRPSGPAAMERRLMATVVDPFEVRDRLLLPIGNRALRNLKRQLTEAQNVALEEVRLDDTTWEPTVDWIRNRVRADLVVLYAESFGAGHSAAEEMVGGRVPRPATPRDEVADDFAEDLVAELLQVISEGHHAGHGARQLGAALSRVFRGWRTDQSERRVRDLSLEAYHRGLVRSLQLSDEADLHWVVAGRGCATCRVAGEEMPAETLPPAHPGCECTVAIDAS
ncbi:MAG: DivIVA domain-containing protein [Acidimicrobiia bacterium]|nr:DivIVA domain-containing protein [Acidimicrobiia bacterium]MDH4309343.1 DivIVA domain-containing protein [Acidimicrobiia bacterium]MDH5292057.1 DivIVA domain-containing protein [Acidimicrobiia bacterium]